MGDYRGISINGADYRTIDHFYIRNYNIHDVKVEVRWIGGSGTDGSGIYYKAGGDASKKSGGIVFDIQTTSSGKTNFNDIVIENCVVTAELKD